VNEALVRVLVVDDDELTTELVSRALSAQRCEVLVALHADDIARVGGSFEPDAVLVDVNIPGTSPDAVLRAARSALPGGTRVFLFSAEDEQALRAMARRVGADGWLSKSTAVGDLGARLRKLLGKEEVSMRRTAKGAGDP
jgi:DNA-binding response OmpR family regulator